MADACNTVGLTTTVCAMHYTVRVWDLPTRLFHWSLAVTIVGSVVSAKIGGNAMVWHLRFGYAVLALLLFRLVWGLVGSHWSRFFRIFVHACAPVALPARRPPPTRRGGT